MAKKRRSLKGYIAEIGDEAFAAQFGIKPRTARAYRLGERFPERKVLVKIVSGSPLSWEDIYSNQ